MRVVGAGTALLERPGAGRAGRYPRPARALQRGDTPGVVVVRVGIHDEPNGLGAKPELADARIDERRRLRQAAVQEDVALVGGNQDRAEPGRPDELRVAENPKWLARAIPGLARSHFFGGSALNPARSSAAATSRSNVAKNSQRLHALIRPAAGAVPGSIC